MAKLFNFKKGLSPAQTQSIYGLLKKGGSFNQTDAQNFAYATNQPNWKQFLNKNIGDYSVGDSQNNIYNTSSLGKNNLNVLGDTGNSDNYLNKLFNSIGSTQSGLKNFMDYFSKDTTAPIEKERTGMIGRLNEAVNKLVGRGKRTQELMTEQKLPENYEQLKNLNTQIAEKMAAYQSGIQKIEGKVMPMPFITGQQAQMQKMSAVELGNLATLAQAMRGNIELSRQMINDTVDLEYADTEQEIANLQLQLEINSQNMTSAEAKRAEALNLYLNKRQEQITAEKEEKIQIRSLALQAVQNGMPVETAQRMMASSTYEEAMSLAGGYLKTPTSPTSISEQISVLDNGYTLSYDTNGNPIVTDPTKGIVGGYDISSYATDPMHEQKVSSILDSIGQFTTPEEIDSYIKSVAPGSPITSDMIQKTSEKYGVSWEMLVAMMQQDSSLGTAGIGAKNFNPGNIGQFDSLGATPTKGYSSWQQGVDAVGNWLANHKASNTLTNAQQIALDIFNGNSSINVDKYPTKQRDAINKALVALKEEAKASGDLEGIIKASAGGKDVAESFIQSFDKAANVVYQINDLQAIFDNDKLSKEYVEQQKKDTGVDLNPIWGKVRKLNPWDKDAQTIKASLQAIVPNLARGIYGEVGVLTDNDIKNYSQTLPTLTSTEEVRRAVLGITIRSVQRAIENKLKSQAASGRDVSGYLSMYQDLKGIADDLLLNSGISTSVSNNGETTSGLTWEVIGNETTPLSNKKNGFWEQLKSGWQARFSM